MTWTEEAADWTPNEALARAIYWAGREYRITYQRRGWVHPRSIYRQGRVAAERYVAKITSNGRPDLAPLDFVLLESRPYGHWEVEEL